MATSWQLTPVNEWLEQQGLDEYEEELMQNGARTLADLIQAIQSKAEIQLCCPSMLSHPFHLIRFISALNKDGGHCALPIPGAAVGTSSTKFPDRTRPGYNYDGMVQAGFICPGAIFVFAFQHQGVLPVPQPIMALIDNLLWAAHVKCSNSLYATPCDFAVMSKLSNTLFPQLTRKAGFIGFHKKHVKFWAKIRTDVGVKHL